MLCLDQGLSFSPVIHTTTVHYPEKAAITQWEIQAPASDLLLPVQVQKQKMSISSRESGYRDAHTGSVQAVVSPGSCLGFLSEGRTQVSTESDASAFARVFPLCLARSGWNRDLLELYKVSLFCGVSWISLPSNALSTHSDKKLSSRRDSGLCLCFHLGRTTIWFSLPFPRQVPLLPVY